MLVDKPFDLGDAGRGVRPIRDNDFNGFAEKCFFLFDGQIVPFFTSFPPNSGARKEASLGL